QFVAVVLFCKQKTAYEIETCLEFRRVLFRSTGQTAAHSPMLVQPPKSSSSCWLTMLTTREARSGCPCGSMPRWVTFAAVNSMLDAFGQAATQAPQPIQVAASNARSASVFGTGLAWASGAVPVGALM